MSGNPPTSIGVLMPSRFDVQKISLAPIAPLDVRPVLLRPKLGWLLHPFVKSTKLRERAHLSHRQQLSMGDDQ